MSAAKYPTFLVGSETKALMSPYTPTPSEHGEWLDGQYDFAWNLWLLAHTGGVGKRNFNLYAAQLDDIPGVDEYFRWLCQYELWCLDWGIPVPIGYLKAQWYSNAPRRCIGTGRKRKSRSRPRRAEYAS